MKKTMLFCCLLLCSAWGIAQVHGGNGNLGPAPGGQAVIFYRDMKYTGMSRVLGQGPFNNQQLGFLAGNVSSVYIPPGQSVTLYDNRGQSKTFTISVANLAQYGWDNRTVSGIIQRNGGGNGGGNGGSHGGNGGSHGGNGRPPGPPPVTRPVAYLFTEPNFRGNSFGCAYGSTPLLNIIADGRASSIQLAPGYTIIVYTGVRFTGRRQAFSGSVINLFPYGWNNIIRSVQIIRRY